MLQRVQTIWGNAGHVRSEPLVEHHYDVIFVPLAENMFLDHDREWGVFDRKGALIDAGGYFRGPERALVGQSMTTSLRFEDLPEAPEPHYVYAGPIINHYGHFVVTTMSRFWQFAEQRPQAPILCHSHGPTTSWFSLGYREALWNAIGLTPQSFATFDRPTRIRKLTIPRPAFEEQNFIHVAMGGLCRHIGRQVLAGRDLHHNPRPLYLSKAALTSGVTRISNEHEIVEHLLRHDVDVVSPETMSFVEQVHEFSTRALVFGTSSSAFHTALFSNYQPHMVVVAPIDLLNSNFLLIDKVRGRDSEYFCPRAGAAQSADTEGFLVNSHVSDPGRLADELLRIIGR